jgi:uncharacterized protein YdiU (UPF0061 family)
MDFADGPSVASLGARADHSWIRHLTPDPETERYAPNRSSREVKSGHYVLVKPTPLRNPRTVLYSKEMLQNLGIDEADVGSERFAAFFSGDSDAVPGARTWATPYALAIMGKRQVQNCPFGTGNGYGDGRAVSVGEVVGIRARESPETPGSRKARKEPEASLREFVPQRWEMQLKGGGPTPFCRGADGRAVLRSSVREFLASEAMHALGVSTTRALSLVVSENGDVVKRPWYDPETRESVVPEISMSDPRLKDYPDETKRLIITRARNQKRDPDTLIVERCAITTRVAPSFVRVGHVDLFARRATRGGADSEARAQLAQMVRHAAFREFPDLVLEHCPDGLEPPLDAALRKDWKTTCPPSLAAAFLRSSGAAIAKMTAGWLRVGFCQGNFNADNCLVAGRTMDYGPFGFMDAYDPFFAKWTGSGEHFAFANQPSAGLANFAVLASSVAPLLAGGETEAAAIVEETAGTFEAEVDATWRSKLGFETARADGSQTEPQTLRASAKKQTELWTKGLEPLLSENEVDFTVAFRQLAKALEVQDDDDASKMFEPMKIAFYDREAAADPETAAKWIRFLAEWREALAPAADRSPATIAEIVERLRAVNPKYVLREWMLVQAYTEADLEGDFRTTKALRDLTSRPYEEGTSEEHAKFYDLTFAAEKRRAGGTAFMS